ncbi:dTDP-4-dehydrorhamnose 3,5-epimerase [Oceanibaculum indicum]|nr:dTDP-4-dehydrorhamnose 3,5-epimerase [Oceanibaculum indicum]
MEIVSLDIPDVKLITPRRFGDNRGFFSETWNRAAFAEAGIEADFVQDNHSLSATVGTLRGLHFQIPPFAQAKLVRVSRGAIFDVAVDIRTGSPTYGKWVGAELSAENWAQMYVPKGFAHGFVTLLPDTEVQYKVDAPYAPEHDRGIAWNDPAIAVDWPLEGRDPVLSGKDAALPALADIPAPFTMETA